MRKRPSDKGEWSYVYLTHFDNGEEYSLLNKGSRWMQDGDLATWNPSKAKSVPLEAKANMTWMWFDQRDRDELHYCDENNVHYSVRFKELICTRYAGGEGESEPIWMDKNGLTCPFTGKYFPAGFNEHIAGRRKVTLPISGVKCTDEDKVEETW